jgi:hypothetical protein
MSNFLKRSRWRRLVCLLFAVCVCLTVAAYSERRQGPFWDKYQKLRLGMTEQDVQDVLGPPMYEESMSFGPLYCTWKEGQETILVSFDDAWPYPAGKYVVVEKRFFPETGWERMRRTAEDFRHWVKRYPWPPPTQPPRMRPS